MTKIILGQMDGMKKANKKRHLANILKKGLCIGAVTAIGVMFLNKPNDVDVDGEVNNDSDSNPDEETVVDLEMKEEE